VKPDVVMARAVVVIGACVIQFQPRLFLPLIPHQHGLALRPWHSAGRLDDDIAGHADQRFDLGAHLPCLGAAVSPLRERRVGRTPNGRCKVMRKGGIRRNTATIESNQGLELEKSRNARRSNPQRLTRPTVPSGSCIRAVDAEFSNATANILKNISCCAVARP
jgi:hypothetical protein